MVEEIIRLGGEATIEDLIGVLVPKFGISDASVRAYATSPSCVKTARGTIRLRSEEDPLPTPPAVELARRCFHLGEGWAYRVTVNEEVTRGSGIVVPTAFVGYVGVKCLEQVVISSDHGPIAVRWPSAQASIGSLRQVAMDLGAQAGDYIFVELAPSRSFRFTRVPVEELAQASPSERIALEVGARLADWDNDLAALLAHALGVIDGRDRSLAGLRNRLRERGDHELADLVGSVASETGTALPDDGVSSELLDLVLS
jgi:hypothetical protein